MTLFGNEASVLISERLPWPDLYEDDDAVRVTPGEVLSIPLSDQLIFEAMLRRLPMVRKMEANKLHRQVVEP